MTAPLKKSLHLCFHSSCSHQIQRLIRLSRFRSEPLRLAGMLVQEDFYLLVEDDVGQERTPSGLQYQRPHIPGYDQRSHEEDHPTGKHHIFTASSSCFSIDAVRSLCPCHSPLPLTLPLTLHLSL